MDKDLEVLNNIYSIVDMGVIGIDNVISKIKDKSIEKLFIDQKKEYNLLRVEAMKILTDLDKEVKKPPKIAEIGSSIKTDMELLKDDSDNNIVKLMIQGSNRGIVELTSILNKKELTNRKVEILAQKLLDLLEHNIQDLKKYL